MKHNPSLVHQAPQLGGTSRFTRACHVPMTHVVFWSESDPVTHEVSRVYRDFPSFASAEAFHNDNKDIKRHIQLAPIADCAWHHSNA